jgi:alpha-amylase
MKRLYTLLCASILTLGLSAQMTYSVTFEVDMNNETVSADGVHVAGNFNDPDNDTNPDNPDYPQWASDGIMLMDGDLDGVYSVTLDLVPATYEFKFINGNVWDYEEDVPNACQVEVDGNSNRWLTVSDADTGMHACFGSCAACGMYTLRFRVDMSLEGAVNPEGVHVAGSFQGDVWDPGADMTIDPDGNMIYEQFV